MQRAMNDNGRNIGNSANRAANRCAVKPPTTKPRILRGDECSGVAVVVSIALRCPACVLLLSNTYVFE